MNSQSLVEIKKEKNAVVLYLILKKDHCVSEDADVHKHAKKGVQVSTE